MLLLIAIFSYFFFDRFVAEHFSCHDYIVVISKYLSKFVAPWFLLGCSAMAIFKKIFLPFVTISFSMFFVGILKMIARRPRPYLYLQEGLYGFFLGDVEKGFLSFPSSHAAVATALATLLSHFHPRYKKVIYLALIPLLLTRIVLQKHFVSDLCVGAFIGHMTALGVLKIEKLLRTRSFFRIQNE